MPTVGCKHTVETCQVNSGLGQQGSEPRYEVQRLEDDMGSAYPPKVGALGEAFATLMGQAFSIRCLQLVANVAV